MGKRSSLSCISGCSFRAGQIALKNLAFPHYQERHSEKTECRSCGHPGHTLHQWDTAESEFWPAWSREICTKNPSTCISLRIRTAVVSFCFSVGSYFPPFPRHPTGHVKKVPNLTWKSGFREATSTFLDVTFTFNAHCHFCVTPYEN